METEDRVHGKVREYYAKASDGGGCGCAPASSCCGGGAASVSESFGYSAKELRNLPPGADLGLGCGNPTAIAALKVGEVVLDLGSGGGIDCFLASNRVGASGRVIGVDMTPEMVAKARDNARRTGFKNVEFRLGEIEHLPVADGTVDVIISNCVINLAPDKRPVYQEAFRALKPGGRLAISDIVATGPVPEETRRDMLSWSQCAAGAMEATELEKMLAEVGFKNIRIQPKMIDPQMQKAWAGGINANLFASANIEAIKN